MNNKVTEQMMDNRDDHTTHLEVPSPRTTEYIVIDPFEVFDNMLNNLPEDNKDGAYDTSDLQAMADKLNAILNRL